MAGAAFSSGGAKRKRAHKCLCGVPKERCSGAQGQTSNGLKGSKTHSTPQEAFACYRRYLLKDGYIQVGNREFTKGDGPIVVLTKKSKFGGKMLRGGKSDRQMPATAATGGLIIGM